MFFYIIHQVESQLNYPWELRMRMCIEKGSHSVYYIQSVLMWCVCVCVYVSFKLNLCVFMHICECVYQPLSVICRGDRGSQHDPQWVGWDLDYSLLPVRGAFLSSERRRPQLWGFAHKPVYSDLQRAEERHIDFLLFLAWPTHSITSERAPCSVQFPRAPQAIRPGRHFISPNILRAQATV